MGLCVCLFVCVRHENEHFERNRAVFELYLLHTSQKSKNISFYMPDEQERTSEKQTLKTFLLSMKLLFNIGDLYQKNDYYHSAAQID